VQRYKAFFVFAVFFVALVPSWAADFTQADLEKMVTELDHVIPENTKYKYPVKCSIVDQDEVNAYATVKKEDDGLRATMVVFTGLVKNINGDQRLIRAVVAHELSHLSRGHLDDINPAARDLKNLWTRQQEFEADKYGAEALVKSGYAKKDMVDLLLFLDKQHGRNGGWLEGLTADHADSKARAAEIADDPSALKALVTYDTALAYEDARSHLYAKKLFDFAAAQWPALTEAYINSGKCALMHYYDNLPIGVRNTWWTPDFGPLITNPHVYVQAIAIEDKDRKRYQDAMAAIKTATEKNPGNEDADALLALGQVMEPDASKDIVQSGIDWFDKMGAATTDPIQKLRYANNEAFGYAQLGDTAKAANLLMAAQRGTNKFNAALGENLGLVGLSGGSKDDETLAANVLYTWLNNTPQASSPRWETVKKTFDDICSKAGIQANEIKPKAAYLCQVVTLVTGDNKEIGLLLPINSLKSLIGEPAKTITFDDRWPDLAELRWNDDALSVFTEKNQAMRLTCYEPGAYLELKPMDPTSQDTFSIKVGMSEADFYNTLSKDSAVSKELAKGGKTETWTYFPSLGMGVLIQDGTVKGITVTPVQYEG
jgi:predicted Zn-dependent protease